MSKKPPAADGDPRNRTDHSNSHRCGDRQRRGVPQGPEFLSLVRLSARRIYNGRQAEASRDQQVRKRVFAPAAGAWRTCDPAMSRKAISWSERLVGEVGVTSTSQRCHDRAGEQNGSRRMGTFESRRNLSTADAQPGYFRSLTQTICNCRPAEPAGLGNRFAIPTIANRRRQNKSRIYSSLLARKEMTKTVEPGAPETCYSD